MFSNSKVRYTTVTVLELRFIREVLSDNEIYMQMQYLKRTRSENAMFEAGLRIRIYFIRIQHFRLNTDPDPDPIRIQGFNEQKLKKVQLKKN